MIKILKCIDIFLHFLLFRLNAKFQLYVRKHDRVGLIIGAHGQTNLGHVIGIISDWSSQSGYMICQCHRQPVVDVLQQKI